MNIYETGLDKNPANYVPLSPLSFLERVARVHPDRTAVVYGERRYTWAETYTRCRQMASALAQRGVGAGDTVSVLGFNTPELFELHFAVPMCGAVLHAINTRLDAKTIAFMVAHAETKLLMTDWAVSAVISSVLTQTPNPPPHIDIIDPTVSGKRLSDTSYEDLINTGDPNYAWQLPADEWSAISLNYTSGTTGDPKGVVYHHRGAYLNAISNVMAWDMPKYPVYLWTLPMFHCNGWCFPWTLAAMAGTNVCLRKVEAEPVYNLIAQEHVTHYCGAPIVHNLLANAPAEQRDKKQHPVSGMVAGAPPPAAVLAAMADNDFDITHVYGLTETYGPAVVNEWKPEWNDLSASDQANLKARQGVAYHVLDQLIVADPDTLEPVPADGKTMGEILFKGNNVMMGYLKNPTTTNNAFAGGWFHSGDLAVVYPDGYIQIRDRAKDIIISGGENISTIEIENAIFKHPAVMDAAVVGKTDEKWGETPCAFVALKPDADPVTETDIISFCQTELARFKAPKHVVFGALPKTSTGKTQKFVLREKAETL